MGRPLKDIAGLLKAPGKKVQLIYAFNGTGKTRLSMEFKELIDPKGAAGEASTDEKPRILYYNAFTEDLFYWDNDLVGDTKRKLKIQSNSYTAWVLKEQGQDQNAIAHFQRYTHDKLTPRFNEEYKIKNDGEAETTMKAFSEVTFSFERGNEAQAEKDIKISKGEEGVFIWSIFYSLIEQVIDVLNVADRNDRETDLFDLLQYVFIDDPVSSLDENYLIALAVDLAGLIKSSTSDLRFVITTHNPLFYNVLCNEFNNPDSVSGWESGDYRKCRMVKHADETYDLAIQPNDAPFSYHLYLHTQLKEAITTGNIQKFHFNFLRNILEKTSTFLGYGKWQDLLPRNDDGRPNPYANRIINLSSHSKHAGEEVIELTEDDKRVLGFLFDDLNQRFRFK